jgi:hypothetical protein
MVFGVIWALLLAPETHIKPVPLYLYYLMFLILGHYFAHRRHAPAAGQPQEAQPLYLPRGSVRFLILVGFVAVLGWGIYNDPNFQARLTPDVTEQPYLLPLIIGAFFVGIIVNRIGTRLASGPGGVAPWFQDVQAWISLVAVLLMGVAVIIHLVINPSLPPERQLTLPNWEGFLSALVAFYFGTRS